MANQGYECMSDRTAYFQAVDPAKSRPYINLYLSALCIQKLKFVFCKQQQGR